MEHKEGKPQPEEFSFLQETIKEETPSRKKTVCKIAKIAGLGLVFGLAASVGFCALKPWAETKFQGDAEAVTIPKDEEEEKEQDQKEAETGKTAPVLTIDNYRELNKALYVVAKEAGKSIVEVTGIRGDEGWLEADFDQVNSVSGLIVADNGQGLLILADTSVLKDAKNLSVTFSDGSMYTATLKKKDENLHLAVISVARSALRSGTLDQINVAALGNSNLVSRGDAVIALGKPFGYAGGLGYGVISSARNTLSMTDGEFDLLLTDITGTAEGTGFLVNLSGEVVGVVNQTLSEGDSKSLVSALGISDLKPAIELLSNETAVPYVGITGTDVTEAVYESQGVPIGVYVKEVAADSPAMKAGIQSGDVITKVGGTKVSTFTAYRNAVLKHSAGEKVRIYGQRSGTNGYVDIDFGVTVGSRE